MHGKLRYMAVKVAQLKCCATLYYVCFRGSGLSCLATLACDPVGSSTETACAAELVRQHILN